MWEVPIPVGKFGRERVFTNDSRPKSSEETSEQHRETAIWKPFPLTCHTK